MLNLHNFAPLVAGSPLFAPLNLNLPSGSVGALTGDNGTGKTSLLRAVAGLLPFVGECRYNGAPAYLPQRTEAVWNLSVREALHPQGLFNAPLPIEAAAVLRLFGLAGLRRRSVLSLSGGEAARVMTAALCARSPRLLLLDEPTASLDRRARVLLIKRLQTFCRQSGAAALVSTHDEQAADAADDMLCLSE